MIFTQIEGIDIQGTGDIQNRNHTASESSDQVFNLCLNEVGTKEENNSGIKEDMEKSGLEEIFLLDIQKVLISSEVNETEFTNETKNAKDISSKIRDTEGLSGGEGDISRSEIEIELFGKQNQEMGDKDLGETFETKDIKIEKRNSGHQDQQLNTIHTEGIDKEETANVSKEGLLKFEHADTEKNDHPSLLYRSVDNAKIKDSIDSSSVSKDVQSGFENENLQMISTKSNASVQQNNSIHHNNRAESINQIINHIIQVSKSPNRLGVSIKEHTLGRLDISVSMHKGVINININVSNHLLRDMIQENMQTILGNLYNEGLDIGGFSVSVKNQQKEEMIPNKGTYTDDNENRLIITEYSKDGLISVFV